MQEIQDLHVSDGKADTPCMPGLSGFDEAIMECNDSDTCLAARRHSMPYTGRSSVGALVMGLTEKLNQNRGRTSLCIGRSSRDVQVGCSRPPCCQ
jgi:hypothetical protein